MSSPNRGRDALISIAPRLIRASSPERDKSRPRSADLKEPRSVQTELAPGPQTIMIII